MISESYREIEPSHVPSQLIIDLDFKPHDLEIDANPAILNFLFDAKPQHHPGEIPIGSDMIHVSGGGRKDDFLDDPLALPSSHGRPSTRLIYFNTKNLEKLIRN